jgi:hypothetical protein
LAERVVGPFDVGRDTQAAFTRDTEAMDEALFTNILAMEMDVPTDAADQVKNTYLIVMGALYEIDAWVDTYSTKAADTVLGHFKEARAAMERAGGRPPLVDRQAVRRLAKMTHFLVDVSVPFHSAKVLTFEDVGRYTMIPDEQARNEYVRGLIENLVIFIAAHDAWEQVGEEQSDGVVGAMPESHGDIDLSGVDDAEVALYVKNWVDAHVEMIKSKYAEAAGIMQEWQENQGDDRLMHEIEGRTVALQAHCLAPAVDISTKLLSVFFSRTEK